MSETLLEQLRVDAHPAVASPYWEWVADWFSPTYLSSDENPLGPPTGSRRVLRGGSWRSNLQELRTVVRISLKPGDTLDTLGFRCVVNP